MSDTHFKGYFPSIQAAWKSFPNGGGFGDYIIVNEERINWNEYALSWGDQSESTGIAHPEEVIDHDIIVLGKATFREGAEFGDYIYGESGANIDDNGNAEFRTVNVDSLFIKYNGKYIPLADYIKIFKTELPPDWEEYIKAPLFDDVRILIFDPVSNEKFYTTIKALKDVIGSSDGGAGGTGNITLLRSDDTEGTPTNNNAFSSLRTLLEIKNATNALSGKYLSKISPDTAKEVITFLEGIIAKGSSTFENLTVDKNLIAKAVATLEKGFKIPKDGKDYGIDVDALALLKHVTLEDGFKSPVFFSGISGEGVRLSRIEGTQNQYVLELQNLIVNGRLSVNEVVVKKWTHVGAGYILSHAGFEIDKVEDLTDRYRVYPKDPNGNTFQVGSQALCQRFDTISINSKRYWILVIGVAADRKYIDLSKTEIEAGSDIPEVGDNIFAYGFRGSDNSLKGAIVMSSIGESGPYIQSLRGIDSFDVSNKTQIFIGDETYFKVNRFEIISGGNSYRVPADRGAWSAGTYYYYDRVTHNGSLWLCLSTSTTVEPSDNVPLIWQKQVATGASGLSVQLSRDSYTFQESSAMRGVVAPNIQVPVEIYAMKGSTRVSVPASAITVSGLPFGMTHTVADNKVTLVTGNGQSGIGYLSTPASYSIIVTVDGVMFTKQFSHSIAWIGDTGEDAYSLTLSKSFHLFTGTTKAATPESVQVEILAYKGGVRLTVLPAAIFISNSNLPTGMSYTKYNNYASFTITPAMMSSGTIPVYITIEGVEYMRHFSYSYAVNAGEIDRIETETKARFSVNETNIQAAVTSITSVQNSVTGLSTRVSEAEAQVLIQAGQISSKASQSDFNALGSRVTTAEQTISAHTGQITTKVSYTEYNANNVAINNQFSQIIQRADSIDISVSNVNNKVDNIQVGGRNLIFGGFENGLWYQSTTGGDTSNAQYGRTKAVLNLTAGKQYTLSMLSHTVIQTGGIWITFLKADNTFNSVLITNSLPFTFIAPAPKCTITYNAVNYTSTSGGLVFGNLKPKLEIGNKATDWTPALEDELIGGRNYFPFTQLVYYTPYSTLKAKGLDWLEFTKLNSGHNVIAIGLNSAYLEQNLNKRIIITGRFLIDGQPVTSLGTLATGQQTLATNYRDTEFCEVNKATGYIKCILGPGTNSYIIHTAFLRNGAYLPTGGVLRIERLMVEAVESGFAHSDYTRPIEDVETEIVRVETETKAKFTITDNSISSLTSSVTTINSNVAGLSTRVTTAEQTISAHTGQIAQRVTLTEYNANNTYITNQFSQITQRADSIELSVSNIQVGGVNLISNLAENWENGYWDANGNAVANNVYIRTKDFIPIDSLQNFIVQSGNAEQLTFRFFNSANAVIQTESRPFNVTSPLKFKTITGVVKFRMYTARNGAPIITPADIASIRIKLESGNIATDWSASPDDRQVGGRNLILYSKDLTFKRSHHNCSSSIQNITNPYGVVDKTLYISFSGNTSNYFRITEIVNESLKEFTFSCWLGRPGYSAVTYAIIANDVILKKVSVSAWTFVSVTFTTKADISVYNFIQITSALDSANALWLYQPKIERGNQATAYTQAPEDLTADLLATGINIVDKKITITANNTIFQNNAGQQVALFNAAWTKINADIIDLSGTEASSGKTKVRIDGTLEAIDGVFSGTVSSNANGNRITISAAERALKMISGSEKELLNISFTETSGVSGSLMRLFGYAGNIQRNHVNHGSYGTEMRAYYGTNDGLSAYSNMYPGTFELRDYVGGDSQILVDKIRSSTSLEMYFNNAFISGFSLYTRRVTSGTTLTRADTVLVISSMSAQTVYLPSNPVTGEIKFIVCENNQTITLNGNGRQIKPGHVYAAGSVTIGGSSSSYSGSKFVIFDGTYWQLLSI